MITHDDNASMCRNLIFNNTNMEKTRKGKWLLFLAVLSVCLITSGAYAAASEISVSLCVVCL